MSFLFIQIIHIINFFKFMITNAESQRFINKYFEKIILNWATEPKVSVKFFVHFIKPIYLISAVGFKIDNRTEVQSHPAYIIDSQILFLARQIKLHMYNGKSLHHTILSFYALVR